MSEFQTKLHSVPSGGFLTDRDKDKKPITGRCGNWASTSAA